MKSFNEFINEAMESASTLSVAVTCTEQEFKDSIKNINWLSGKFNGGVVNFFGPQSDIDRWVSKNSQWLKD